MEGGIGGGGGIEIAQISFGVSISHEKKEKITRTFDRGHSLFFKLCGGSRGGFFFFLRFALQVEVIN